MLEYIVYRLPRELRGPFEEACAKASGALAAAPECKDFELSRCVEEPELYIWRIAWESLDAHLKGFRQSGHFEEYFGALKDYFPYVDQMHHYEKVPLTGK
ncbi:MAG: antibiotic biosynthesis monooxygenase [Desulfovibrionaceae bacterium]|nr:antibiotic biosynthesis monooxygenase [Desulfovibrionaceae bacterium]MBF0512768.1 antibiotic biosynthesis monooxygenase [Desulfovibrionaceae bacterium]